MLKNRSGQGASEYLIILAVVLIVALVAIGLLGAFPSFGGDARESETKQYWASTHPFAIVDFNQQTDTMVLSVKNVGPDRLTLTNITISNVSNATSVIFIGGATKTLSVSGLQRCNATTYDYFQYDNVTISYTSSYINNRFTGAKPLLGPCVTG
ncbi:Uncharacterised protein [uncultured archaeon]|nr:Uncharacterised protein [uncultured archaeon]